MKKIAMVFPGQGSQYIGMGESFYKNYMICRQTFEEASDIAGTDVAKLCFKDSVLRINQIEEMQLAVTTTNVAIARAYFEQYGVAPQFAMGHSVGEYAALTCAGAISFEDTIKILKYRGEILKDSLKQNLGTMVIAENIDYETVKNIIESKGFKNDVFVAAYNAPKQLLLSGREDAMDELDECLLDADARITPLLTSPPMHSPLLLPYEEDFKKFLEEFRFYPFRFPIISNLYGKPFSDPTRIPEILSKHLTNPVLWADSVECCKKYGIDMVIEAGPKNLLINLLKELAPNMDFYCFGQKRDREYINDEFTNDPNYKKDVPEFLGRCLGIAVSVQNHNFDKTSYEKGVDEPYRQIKKMQDNVRESGKITQEDMSKGIRLLREIFDCKQVPKEEQENWLKRLLDETNTFYTLKEEIES